MRPGTTEFVLGVLFEFGLDPKCPLLEQLQNKDFKLPFSFIFGENDWVLNLDEGAS